MSDEEPENEQPEILSGQQRATLAAIVARLIPGSPGDPGGLEANVPLYIMSAIESPNAAATYVAGLSKLDAYAVQTHRLAFTQLGVDAQHETLAELERGEAGSDLQRFFNLVLGHSIEGMFGAPNWRGNAGFAGWKLLDYPGPRFEWRVEEQQLDVVITPTYEV